MKAKNVFSTVLWWSARVLAVVLFLFWGAFFVEHLVEWFTHPAEGLPPPKVWLLQLAHFIMLVGLIVMLRWEIAGVILSVMGALAFFVPIAGNRLPWFLGITTVPAVLILLRLLLERTAVPDMEAKMPP